MKLDKQLADETVVALQNFCNKDVIEMFQNTGAIAKKLGNEDNEIVQQFLAQGKKTEELYNDCIETVISPVIKEFVTQAELADYMATKASVGSVQDRQVSAGIDQTEIDSVMAIN